MAIGKGMCISGKQGLFLSNPVHLEVQKHRQLSLKTVNYISLMLCSIMYSDLCLKKAFIMNA